MKLAEIEIGIDQSPFIIAEMSGNHDGSLDRAMQIVDAVADSGAHALKLQTYTADTMTLDSDRPEFRIDNPSSLWYGRRLYDLYREAHTPWEWHTAIFARATSRGLLAFSSAFDYSSVDFLESLDVPCYKIASFECIDLPLIARAASTGKPLIISTGMATMSEIDDAVGTARQFGCSELVLLKCTSSYPADPGDSNLLAIPALRERFDCEVGLSDHTLGTEVAVSAVALGATVVEKHVTISRLNGGVDSAFSAEPHELRQLVESCSIAQRAVGTAAVGPTQAELPGRSRRRSLYFVDNLDSGQTVMDTDVRSIRPGLGLPPKYLTDVIGRTLRRDVKRGEPVSWDCFRER